MPASVAKNVKYPWTYPQRWRVEEFFNFNQALGWNRGGTTNLNIRYGQMTLALIAQTVIHQLRTRLGEPYDTWEADHFAHDLFFPLEGDVRVRDDTIVVTYYNAPNAAQLREHSGLAVGDASPRPCSLVFQRNVVLLLRHCSARRCKSPAL